MTRPSIWQTYIFKQLLQGFLFFLCAFFLLYSLIDFATHGKDFSINGFLQWEQLFSYYGYQFIKRISLLLPLALLIATIRVLYALNNHKELVALQSAGIKLKKILSPFFLLATLCTLIGYFNEEIFFPQALSYMNKDTVHDLGKQNKPFVVLTLADGSKLVYQKFDLGKNAFFDVYWIRSFQDIWRMKYLTADPKHPVGEYVDHIVREAGDSFLHKHESYEKVLFPDLTWEESLWNKKQITIKHQKISELFSSQQQPSISSQLQKEMRTHLFYKLVMPLLPFLVLFGVIPFCVKYSRSPPLFMVYGCAIFSFIVFFAWMNAMVILGENQVLPPFIVIFAPFFLCSIILYGNYRRII